MLHIQCVPSLSFVMWVWHIGTSNSSCESDILRKRNILNVWDNYKVLIKVLPKWIMWVWHIERERHVKFIMWVWHIEREVHIRCMRTLAFGGKRNPLKSKPTAYVFTKSRASIKLRHYATICHKILKKFKRK